MKIILFLLLFTCFLACTSPEDNQSSGKNLIRIGFMGETLDANELKAVHEFLSNQKSYEIAGIDAEGLIENKRSLQNLTHLWIHQLSQDRDQFKQIILGKTIKEFVEHGGNLILSMEAVGLLNDWNIENNIFEIESDSITDDGFGRPLGFHGFKSHPIFDGLHGGVYPWKSKEDHTVRKIGFFDDHLPDTTIARIVGVEWTYITFHENNKLVLEYQLGKGKIIAVGAFSYFAAENYNTHELHRFYVNVFEYLAGNSKDSKSRYWDYSSQEVEVLDLVFSPIDITKASTWDLPELTIDLKKEEATENLIIISGRRIMVTGKQTGGIDEVWTNPFMSFRDIETGVMSKNSDDIFWLNDLTPSITSSPELLIREYKIGETLFKEIITVSMDKPLGVVHYEWAGEGITKVFLKYTSNFRYMWPYSENVTSTIRYRWAPEMNAAIASAQFDELISIVGFSSKPENYALGRFKEFDLKNGIPKGIETELNQISGLFKFDAKDANGKLSLYMMAGEQGLEEAIDAYQTESKDFNHLFKKSSNYYKGLLSNSLMLTTPDEEFNAGYRWALLRTDQFFQETPDLGTTMVAGLGTTDRGWDGGQKINGRPGYAWYFGRDAEWCGFAVDAYGGHEQVKKILEVLTKFQNLNGKIFHELTTSGAVHYDASDASPLYVALAAHYLKYSGDLNFIRKIWPPIKKAMDFCYSTDTDEDGLIEITNVGHGWVEGGALFGTHTELYLAGCWAAALDAASYMANGLGEEDLSHFYKKGANKVKEIIDRDFWNEDKEYFYVGKMADGSYKNEESVLSSVPIYFDAVLDVNKAAKTASSFATNQYSTDWGVRILPEASKSFNPRSYHAGMVWPLFGGWAALSEYKTGNYVSGYSHVMNNLLMYRQWNLGSIEETLNGETFKPAGVCSQQAWSETMVLQPIAEGMLGIDPDALTNRISLSPRFPWQWNEVKVDNIIFGNHVIDFKMTRTATSTTFQFEEKLKKGSVMFLSPSLPLGTVVEKVTVDGKVVKHEAIKSTESVLLSIGELTVNSQTTVEITHRNGIGAIPIVNRPEPGDTNKGAKIIRQQLEDNQFDIVIEGLPGLVYQFKIMSNAGIENINSGQIVSRVDNIYTIETQIPASSQKYKEQKISINLKP